MTTGEKIRQIRKQRKMSQQQLAVRCGISQSAISAIEMGLNSPTIGTLQIIAKGLRVPVTNFTDEEHYKFYINQERIGKRASIEKFKKIAKGDYKFIVNKKGRIKLWCSCRA